MKLPNTCDVGTKAWRAILGGSMQASFQDKSDIDSLLDRTEPRDPKTYWIKDVGLIRLRYPAGMPVYDSHPTGDGYGHLTNNQFPGEGNFLIPCAATAEYLVAEFGEAVIFDLGLSPDGSAAETKTFIDTMVAAGAVLGRVETANEPPLHSDYFPPSGTPFSGDPTVTGHPALHQHILDVIDWVEAAGYDRGITS